MGKKRFKNNLGAIRKLELMIAEKASKEDLNNEKKKNNSNLELLRHLSKASSNHSKNINELNEVISKEINLSIETNRDLLDLKRHILYTSKVYERCFIVIFIILIIIVVKMIYG